MANGAQYNCHSTCVAGAASWQKPAGSARISWNESVFGNGQILWRSFPVFEAQVQSYSETTIIISAIRKPERLFIKKWFGAIFLVQNSNRTTIAWSTFHYSRKFDNNMIDACAVRVSSENSTNDILSTYIIEDAAVNTFSLLSILSIFFATPFNGKMKNNNIPVEFKYIYIFSMNVIMTSNRDLRMPTTC